MITPLQKYQQDLERPDFHFDAAQQNAVKHLQRLFDDFLAQKPVKTSLWQKLLGKSPMQQPLKGLYFWGGVGRGKTYLVDTFYDCLPTERKMRIHFHRFMHKVHDEMKTLAGQANPLEVVADRFKAQTDIICFDEFFVSDITDAMILGTLMIIEKLMGEIRQNLFLKIGQNTLTIYIIHMILLYGSLTGIGVNDYFNKNLTPWEAAIGALTFISAHLLIIYFLDYIKEKLEFILKPIRKFLAFALAWQNGLAWMP
jgi:hypothetical protein